MLYTNDYQESKGYVIGKEILVFKNPCRIQINYLSEICHADDGERYFRWTPNIDLAMTFGFLHHYNNQVNKRHIESNLKHLGLLGKASAYMIEEKVRVRHKIIQ